MKKMNFVFRSRVFDLVNSRMGLMIFSLLLLFGFGFNSANAQYVSDQDAHTILVKEVVSVDDNMDTFVSSGNTTEVERAEFKIQVLKTMVENLEKGFTVRQVIEMTIGSPAGTATMTDAHLANKQGSNQWLIDEILEMLTL
jgi:hypothetical protein